MTDYRITPRAGEDLRSIGRYTGKHWGKDQRNRYLKELGKRFQWLANDPQHGKCRDEIAAGYYSYPQGQHVIFYLVREQGIDVIGIPHKAMDIQAYFSPNDLNDIRGALRGANPDDYRDRQS